MGEIARKSQEERHSCGVFVNKAVVKLNVSGVERTRALAGT